MPESRCRTRQASAFTSPSALRLLGRTYERVGYKLGAGHDVGYWQLSVQTNDGASALPRPLPDLLDNQELQQELQTGSEKLAHDLAEVATALDAWQLPYAA